MYFSARGSAAFSSSAVCSVMIRTRSSSTVANPSPSRPNPAPVTEPMDRFVVRSRDGVMLFLHDGHDLRRLGLGPFEKRRPENQVFAFVMRMQNLEHKLCVRTDESPALRIVSARAAD